MKKIALLIILLISFSSIILPAQDSDVFIPFNSTSHLLAGSSLFSEAKTGSFQQDLKPVDRSDPTRKSPGTALLLSLIVPGAGEWYMGKKDAALVFFGVEVVVLSGLLTNNLYADHLKKEYKTYAVQHAGVDRAGKGVQYWIDIGKWDDIYSFNEQRRRERYFAAIYVENQQNYWSWDSRDNRLRYDGKRLRANEIINQAVYFQAAVLLNHLISGINAMRLARKHNRELESTSQSYHLQFDSYPVDRRNNYLGLNFLVKF